MTDRGHLYDSPDDYFSLHGSVLMKLSPEAAKDVCVRAASEGLVVARIEGGFWHNPAFEARRDCIWDGADPPISQEAAHANNLLAAEFIQTQSATHSAFVLTSPPITGWPHKVGGSAL